jgi:hypothetical protein
MANDTHTPGPWTVVHHPDTEGAYTILEANREQRHWVFDGYEISDEEGDRRAKVAEERSERNQKLIEAAPDLLDILECITRSISMKGPAGTTAYIIPALTMATAKEFVSRLRGEQA